MHTSSEYHAETHAGFGLWILSCLMGFVLLPIVVGLLMPLVFGVDRRDSSAVWGLAGAVPLIVAIVTSPAYFLGQIGAFLALRPKATRLATLVYSVAIGIGFGFPASCGYWLSIGGGKILQSN